MNSQRRRYLSFIVHMNYRRHGAVTPNGFYSAISHLQEDAKVRMIADLYAPWYRRLIRWLAGT